MNDTVLIQIVEGNQDLDCKSLDQIKREALEMIHLNELVQVDREHLEGDHEVLSEVELVHSTDDVLLVLRIFFIQVLDQFCLNQSLFVESFFVFQYFKSTVLPLLVIIAFKNDAKATLADLFDDLVSISEMLVDLAEVFV